VPITRRQILAATLAASAWRSQAYAATDGQAVFWRVEKPGRSENFLFGYVRIAASRARDIVRDGKKLVDQTERFIVNVPNINMPEAKAENLTPIWKVLSKPVADELRPILSGLSEIETIPGLMAILFLMGEGQTPVSPEHPTVGDEIARYAHSLGRELTSILSEEEMLLHWRPPDLAAVNRQVDEQSIAFLLELRRRVGPIGAHLEQLYSARRGDEISRINDEMDRAGIPMLRESLDSLEGALLDRLERLLYLPDAPGAFVALSLDMIIRKPDVLAWLRDDGYTVTPVS
jgi:hypothetical protein